MRFTVAIDGPAAAGKGTISKAVAQHFGMRHLDTGLLYRAVGVRVLEGEGAVVAAKSLTMKDFARDDLRTPEVAQAASQAAADPEVRAALIAFQREFAADPKGAVLDGRDIGTVICPDAQVKLFVTASPETRAERRYLELKNKGLAVTRDEVQRDVAARDARDRDRDAAPMVAADDAVILDTSDLSIEAAVARAVDLVNAAMRESPAKG